MSERRLSRLSRLGDVPVVVMLAWAGWLAVPWSFSGLAQARAAAAAAAEPLPPDPAPVRQGDDGVRQAEFARAEGVRQAVPYKTWGLPAAAQRDAIAVERARIAGEVHDAAGHGLAAIAMQAGVALITLDDDPEQARASLLAIQDTSRRALAQLRAALDGIDAPVGELPELLDGVRAAGLPVDVTGAATPPPHLQGTVYRVVRESLTNVLRHAGPTRASVRLAADPCEFVVEVADRGSGWQGGAEGRGLSGMRARVAAAGGAFSAGPRDDGGFRVVARFPWQGSA
ncbi:histidine kinase [Nonomuraea sp. NBC_01738]|uniref:sensor histidine kinase n=1 Tax=Nonomuraea sp. NBC_01738 TaxID=2976003 RepID=UPI002E151FB2|nr:histidine kinase [Nonomuraea sp. NBC_01738]